MTDEEQSQPSGELEVECADGEAAEAEAARRQAAEDDPEMEWIYLRNKQEVWVARRVRRDGGVSGEPKASGGAFLSAIFRLLGS